MTKEKFDLIVLGGGHAGCEAVLAAARMGKSVAMITLEKAAIGRMSCNPAIGGLAKGHLAREVDALGGEMGRVTDQTAIQFKMLNTTKGPAVWAPRAQCDKYQYQDEMRKVIESQAGITLIEDMVTQIIVKGDLLKGVKTQLGRSYECRALILTTGTFLNGLMHTGEETLEGGRIGEEAAKGLTESLMELGFKVGRLKTGTPPRLHKASIDFSKTIEQKGDLVPKPFSFDRSDLKGPQISCYITYTNEKTKQIILDNIHRSPLYSGKIKGIGPRYCPSIEDKVVRFADKERHQIFLEPESLSTDEIYVNGCSTSLPKDVQEQFIRSIPGLEKAEFLRYGYAVEYDFVFPSQIFSTMETKRIKNLFLAGQINGTSGYEEAAAQGIVAGINAVLSLDKKPPFIIDRSQAYIGVLIDDLTTKEVEEPYRMFTSRAEHRLLLRQDNADLRLTELGYKMGLVSEDRYQRFDLKRKEILKEIKRLKNTLIETQSLAQLLRRPELRYPDILEIAKQNDLSLIEEIKRKRSAAKPEKEIQNCAKPHQDIELTEIERQVEIDVKYEGYLGRQKLMVDKFKRMEEKKFPKQFDFKTIPSLSTEGREKLIKFAPSSIGQASRISGVSPADISILLVWLERSQKQLKAAASRKN